VYLGSIDGIDGELATHGLERRREDVEGQEDEPYPDRLGYDANVSPIDDEYAGEDEIDGRSYECWTHDSSLLDQVSFVNMSQRLSPTHASVPSKRARLVYTQLQRPGNSTYEHEAHVRARVNGSKDIGHHLKKEARSYDQRIQPHSVSKSHPSVDDP